MQNNCFAGMKQIEKEIVRANQFTLEYVSQASQLKHDATVLL